MANMKYFADINGESFELTRVGHDGNISSAASHFSGLLPNGTRIQATRAVEYKSRPSKHECNAKCMGASGKSMKCECACGGKNHGAAA
jgi:hypothetical protein